MKYPDDANGDVLRRMEARGDDLTRPRDLEFTVVFPDENVARQFADYFSTLGYAVSVELTETVENFPWDVVVVKHMAPSHNEIQAFRESRASPPEVNCQMCAEPGLFGVNPPNGPCSTGFADATMRTKGSIHDQSTASAVGNRAARFTLLRRSQLRLLQQTSQDARTACGYKSAQTTFLGPSHK